MGDDNNIPIKYHKIKNSFLLKRKIGKGSFGTIYSAENIHTGEKVGVKFEKVSAKKKS
jgi:serine/threonine protein kinase